MPTLRSIADRLKAAFTKKRLLWGGGGLGVALALLMLVPAPAHALGCSWYDLPCHAAHLLTWFFQILTALMGFILVLETDALIRVAQYNNFVAPGPTAVKVGWVVTRDLANMFFIVFLMIIAFDTVIRGGDSTYGYRKNLRRLLIMAVVINFSKTICGLFIDMSQVLLLSFVNGFKAAAAGNFLSAFQVNKLLSLTNGDGDYTFALVLAMMFAFIMAAIAASIMLILLVMMTFRIVTLWVLIILSPIAFLTSSFPLGTKNYYAEWWGMFKANLTSGPIVAFFIWLALATAQQTGGQLSGNSEGWPASTTVAAAETQAAGSFKGASIPTEAGTSDTILSMIIVICILMAGLKQASEQQVVGQGFAKKVRGSVEGALKRAYMAPAGAVTGAAGLAYGAAASRVKQAGYGIAGATLTRLPGLRGIGAVAKSREEGLREQRRKSIEKLTGTEEQKAKFMPPDAYAKRIGGLKETDRQMEAFKLGKDNPSVAQALYAAKKDKNGEAYTEAGLAAVNVMRNGKAKEAMEMADLMSSDKNFNAAMKRTKKGPDGKDLLDADGNPQMEEGDLLRLTRERLQGIGKADANLKGKSDTFDQKFVSQFAQMDKLGPDGKPTGEKILGDAELKKMVPKMSADDIGGLDAGGLKLLTKYMNDAQFTKARESTANNKEKADALRDGSATLLAQAFETADASKIADAAKRAIHAGALKAEDLDPKAAKHVVAGDEAATARNQAAAERLRGAIGNRMDVGSLVRGMDRTDEGQRAAVSEVMRSVMNASPERARNMRKQEQYQDFMPSVTELNAQDEGERRSVQAEKEVEAARKAAEASQEFARELSGVSAAVAKAKQDLEALGNVPVGQNESTTALESAYADKERKIKDVERSQAEYAGASRQKSSLEAQLARVAATDAAAAQGIRSALENVGKTMQRIEKDLVRKKKDLEGGAPAGGGTRV